MKHLFTIMLLATTFFGTVSSYAWVCTFVGPHGAVYSRNGEGYGKNVAYDRALRACREHKVHNGVPCEFRGCVR